MNLHAKYYTVAEFKDKFKVGDLIRGASWANFVVITAIGEGRFLYRQVSNSSIQLPDESVSTIRNVKWEAKQNTK